MNELLVELTRCVGSDHLLTGSATDSYLTDYYRRFTGQALAVVRPADTVEVAEIVQICRAHRAPIVTQGGNTGLVGAATPDTSGNAVLLSTQRLSRIRAIDTDNDTITVEAGVTLERVQQFAREANRLFPLSLGSEGSCTIGGNLATNAGGTQVLRYGSARDLTLGLEVVTAEGKIWNGLRGLRKDNTGYALREIYVGSEGTLGIITCATLKLYPMVLAQGTAFVAFCNIDAAIAFLSVARSQLGAGLTAFELVSDALLQLIADNVPDYRISLRSHADSWYAIIEFSDGEGAEHGRVLMQNVLGAAMETGLIEDAVIAESLQQAQALWALRHGVLGKAQQRDGANIKHDVSIPISRIPTFLRSCSQALERRFPGVRVLAFGHLGDGNLHYHVLHAPDQSVERLFELEAAIHETVHDCVHAHDGSISAEHGIGQAKRLVLPRYKDAIELDLMRRLKQAFDPMNLMNPGKVLTPEQETSLGNLGHPKVDFPECFGLN